MLDRLVEGREALTVDELDHLDLRLDPELAQDRERIEIARARSSGRAVEVPPQGIEHGIPAVGPQVQEGVPAGCGVELDEEPARFGHER